MNTETLINLLAGGFAGTMGAVVTCPLEVVKTRLQSSSGVFPPPEQRVSGCNSSAASSVSSSSSGNGSSSSNYCSTKKQASPSTAKPKPQRCFSGQLWADRFNATSAQRVDFSSSAQSSTKTMDFKGPFGSHHRSYHHPGLGVVSNSLNSAMSTSSANPRNDLIGLHVWKHLKDIVKNEGFAALWRGLGPTLIGVAPSRAIYFCTYSNSKSTLNDLFVPETPVVHMFSAAAAGFCSATCTNPVWLIRTRLQLDRMTGHEKLTVFKCMKNVHSQSGIAGFYKGVTASYIGIAETIIHFVIYEYLKSKVTSSIDTENGERQRPFHFLQYMACAGASRMIATTVAYPHEVLRTRLREEGTKYKNVRQSVKMILHEESWRGFYRGLPVHLLRSIPNTAVTMATYELVVHWLLNS